VKPLPATGPLAELTRATTGVATGAFLAGPAL
jgi:hypothetical protein